MAFGGAAATSVQVTGYGGDGRFAIGEVQFNGGAAVPEPATGAAVMILGLGGVGAMLRRRTTALA